MPRRQARGQLHTATVAHCTGEGGASHGIALKHRTGAGGRRSQWGTMRIRTQAGHAATPGHHTDGGIARARAWRAGMLRPRSWWGIARPALGEKEKGEFYLLTSGSHLNKEEGVYSICYSSTAFNLKLYFLNYL